MYLLVEQRNSGNATENELGRTEIRKICQETNSCSIFTHAEIIGLTFGGLGLVLDFLYFSRCISGDLTWNHWIHYQNQ